MKSNVSDDLRNRIVSMFKVKTANELFRSNPKFVKICWNASLSFEETLALDAMRIAESLEKNVVVTQVRNKDKIKSLWDDFDINKHGQTSYSEFLTLMIDQWLPPLDSDANDGEREDRLELYMKLYLCHQHSRGIKDSPIDFRQLGTTVGIYHPEQVSRIVNEWLDERKWLGLVEAGVPNPKKRKANSYALLNPESTRDTLKDSCNGKDIGYLKSIY